MPVRNTAAAKTIIFCTIHLLPEPGLSQIETVDAFSKAGVISHPMRSAVPRKPDRARSRRVHDRLVAVEATGHEQIQRRKAKGRVAKSVLRLPDLEVAKSAVLNSLSCPDAQRGYRHAIDEFVDWYCSEPRLSFSKTVVIRYRMHLESRHLAPGTINLRLGAVRRLAYEAADCGLLSAYLAAGIRRVKALHGTSITALMVI